jgi:predicted NBD/HSP70 family sugar kinase
MRLHAGIDLGGTKSEAGLFDDGFALIESCRWPTPKTYEGLVNELVEQAAWLRQIARGAELSRGLGGPGLIDPETGRAQTAKQPATRQPRKADLHRRLGLAVPVGKDLKCFALSEANGGAGSGYRSVFGLILGTGVGGAFAENGRISSSRNELTGEIGHIGIPLRVSERFGLPLWSCGCGLTGCFESYASGPGLIRMARHFEQLDVDVPALIARRAKGDPAARHVFDIWLALVGDLLLAIQLAYDPDCVVVGGGLSKIDGIERDLSAALKATQLPGAAIPAILKPRFGDSSGTRGAALLGAGKTTDQRQ